MSGYLRLLFEHSGTTLFASAPEDNASGRLYRDKKAFKSVLALCFTQASKTIAEGRTATLYLKPIVYEAIRRRTGHRSASRLLDSNLFQRK